MSTRRAQTALLGILLVSLSIGLSAVAIGYQAKQYFPDEFQTLVTQVLGQFAGPLSIAGGSYFAARRRALQRPVPMSAFLMAVSLTGVWCFLTAGRTVLFVLSTGERVADLVAWNAQIETVSSYVVNSALAYFFVSSSEGSHG